MKASAANIRKLLGRSWGTWGELKNKLVEVGVVKSFYEDAPTEWVDAWQRFSGRRGRGMLGRRK